MAISFWTRLLDVMSPRRCVGCKNRLLASEQCLCASCLLQLPKTGFSKHPLDNELARLFWGVIPLERASAFFYYRPDSLSAHIVHSMKYYGRQDVGRWIGLQMARQMAADGFFEDVDAIVPMPITRERRRERGYNQSECIARGMADYTGIPVRTDVVERVVFTVSQTRKTNRERQQNVDHAFRLANGSGLENRHVLLVDDVVTTGSTAKACGLELARVPGLRISIAVLGFTKSVT